MHLVKSGQLFTAYQKTILQQIKTNNTDPLPHHQFVTWVIHF
ncbi:hypothetical protein A1D15_1082 [Lactiplantibacillus plantarum]|nr:hypothetical protein Lp90_1078 [Lactiplantibacillus plantarum]KZU95295.1 hypothetical protein A1D15_1082 [Lactiplantibacillus plantarum]